MSKADTWETGMLDLTFLNTAFTLLGDAAGLPGSATAGSLFLSLHTADAGESGNQTTNEASYTGYARVAVPRSAAGFSRSGNTISLAANVTFPQSSSGPQTLTNWGLGTSSSGAGKLLYKGALQSSIIVNSGTVPEILAGSIVSED